MYKKNKIFCAFFLLIMIILFVSCSAPSSDSEEFPDEDDSSNGKIMVLDSDTWMTGFTCSMAVVSEHIYISCFSQGEEYSVKTLISSDESESWVNRTLYETGIPACFYSTIAAEGNTVYLVGGYQHQSPYSKLILLKSINNGNNWDMTIIGSGEDSYKTTAIDAEGDKVFIAAGDYDEKKINFIKSLDRGVTWSKSTIVESENLLYLYKNAIDTEGSTVCVAWIEQAEAITGSSNNILYAAVSQDDGSTWVISKLADSYISNPDITIEDGDIYIVYSAESKLQYSVLRTETSVWSSHTIEGELNGISYPSILVDNNTIYVFYDAGRLTLLKSIDNGVSWKKTIVDDGLSAYGIYTERTGDSLYICYCDDFGQGLKFAYSSDGGECWFKTDDAVEEEEHTRP